MESAFQTLLIHPKPSANNLYYMYTFCVKIKPISTYRNIKINLIDI